MLISLSEVWYSPLIRKQFPSSSTFSCATKPASHPRQQKAVMKGKRLEQIKYPWEVKESEMCVSGLRVLSLVPELTSLQEDKLVFSINSVPSFSRQTIWWFTFRVSKIPFKLSSSAAHCSLPAPRQPWCWVMTQLLFPKFPGLISPLGLPSWLNFPADKRDNH